MVGLLGPKFWKIYRKEGLMRAILRGKPYKYAHEKAGYEEEVVRCAGTDEFGNRYYEDFTHHNWNTRRWVEYADYGKWQQTPKKVAPGWHGWLHYQYDDPPNVRSPLFLNFLCRRRTMLSPIIGIIGPLCSRLITLNLLTSTLDISKTKEDRSFCKFTHTQES